MFVSIAVDPGSEGRAKELAELLIQYGFEKVQRGLWESAFVSPSTLTRLKRDLDRSTDAFDRLRLFQFPVDGTLVLSTLRDKKWRRLVARGGEVPVQAVPVKTVPVIPARRTVARPVRPYRR
ncbi:MAG: CRISPR-associated protein Cas2 [Treponema sp.]|nr:CRISPR-associated protein Cas2 [Treponema sp.]